MIPNFSTVDNTRNSAAAAAAASPVPVCSKTTHLNGDLARLQKCLWVQKRFQDQESKLAIMIISIILMLQIRYKIIRN